MLIERVLRRAVRPVLESDHCMSEERRYKYLYLAAEFHRPKDLQHLISSGVDVNRTDERGDTALHLLAAAPVWTYYDTRMSVRALLEGGALWEAQDAQGRTPLHVAIDADHLHTARTILHETLRYVIHSNCP